MQHGLIDYAQMVQMLQASPLHKPFHSCESLGMRRHHRQESRRRSMGIIVPMVNSQEDAERSAACRYAPLGIRSYGPLRANYLSGFDYFDRANREVGMHRDGRDKGAVDNVEEIVSVPGVDAVYVGPADLSVTLASLPHPTTLSRALRTPSSGSSMRADDTTSYRALPGTPQRRPNDLNRGFDWSRSRRMPDCWRLAQGTPGTGSTQCQSRRSRRTCDGEPSVIRQ